MFNFSCPHLYTNTKDAVAREKESDPDFNDSEFEDIDTFFVLENVVQIQEMFKEIEGRLIGREWAEEENSILREWYPVEGYKVENRLNGRTKGSIRVQAMRLVLKAPNLWRDEEIEVLKKYYPVEGYKVADRLNSRTKQAIKIQALRLGLKVADNTWTEEENDILKKYYSIEGIKVVDRVNDRTDKAVMGQAKKLGLSYSVKKWTEEEIRILKRWYPVEGIKVKDRLDGRTVASIKLQAGRLQLKYKNSNKYKYVYKDRHKYVVTFSIDGKNKYFGSFDSEEEAAKVAMEKAKEYGKAI